MKSRLWVMEDPALRVLRTRGVEEHSYRDRVSFRGRCCDVGALCGKYKRRLRNFMPVNYKNEIVELLKLAGPVFISQLLVVSISLVSTVFCGHLGRKELAGVALSTAVINVTGISIGTGLASACDTLISQTFGSGNLKRVGVILQQAVLILLLACFPCWAVLINTEPVLLATGQDPEVARLSQMYVKIFMPALPATFMYQLLGKYLQNQGIIWPQVITGAVGNVLNVLINFIFLYALEFGVAGSAAANAISQTSLVLLLYVYTWRRGLHKPTWDGWSRECLQDWAPFMQLAVPSMLMMCLEWWMFEIGGFLAGVVSDLELGAQSVLYGLSSATFMLPMALSVATCVRIGNALGAGNTEQAQASGKISLICTFAVCCVVGAILGFSKDVVGYIFTTEKDIIRRVSDVMIMFAFFHPADAVAAVTGGIVRGTGKQKIGALCNIVGYYCIGFPIGVSMMFAAKMGIVGLWWGLFICVVLQSTFLIIFLIKLNWIKATEEALVRAGVRTTQRKEMPGIEHDGKQQLFSPMVPRIRNQNLNHFIPPDHALTSQKELQVNVISSTFPANDVWNSDTEALALADHSGAAAGGVVSVGRLLLHRGLAALFMLLILVAGISLNGLLMSLIKK